MRQLYSIRRIDGEPFIMAEHISDSVSAQVAAFEYRCGGPDGTGVLCRLERDEKNGVYYVWIGPPRKHQVRTLPGEHIRRDQPFSLVPRTRKPQENTPSKRSHVRKIHSLVRTG